MRTGLRSQRRHVRPVGKKKLVERLCDRYIPKKICWSQQRWVNFLLVRCLTAHNAPASAHIVYETELVPITCLVAFTVAPSAVRSQQKQTDRDMQNVVREVY